MLEYRLDDLHWEEFEQLCQALIKARFGVGIEAWGGSGDGGNDAYCRTSLRYPGNDVQTGPFQFQVKFVQGANAAGAKPRIPLVTAVKRECERIKRRNQPAPQVYSLLTNVVLSAQLRQTIEGLLREALPGCLIVVLHGGNDVCSWLHLHGDVLRMFPKLLSHRDLSELLRQSRENASDRATYYSIQPLDQSAASANEYLSSEIMGEFFHEKVLSDIEARLVQSSRDICVLGLPGSGVSTTLKEFARRRPGVKVIDWRDLPRHEDLKDSLPSTGIVAVLGHPGVQWLAKLKTLIDSTRVKIVSASAVAPEFMEPVLMPPLGDDHLVAMLGPCWSERILDAVWATGRSPGAALRLRGESPDLSREEIRKRIWNKRDLDDAKRAFADLDRWTRGFLATVAIRGSVAPVEKELWIRLLSAASMERLRELDGRNPLSPFLLTMQNGGVLLRPEIACFIEASNYAEALPRLGYKIISSLSQASELYELLAAVGRGKFRSVLDDARTIAFTKVPASTAEEKIEHVALVGSLGSQEEIDVKTRWRVIAHIVQLLPTWRENKVGLPLWNQLLSAIVRSRDIDVRLRGAEELLESLLGGVRDQLRSHPHWSLKWSRDAIPGPLLSEMFHHEPGIIIPEVNAVVFGEESGHLWSADSAGFVRKWRWPLGRGSKFGPIKDVQGGEVWSIAVTTGGAVLSASDDGSVAVRSDGRFQPYPMCRGGMMNAVAVADGIAVAGDDDSRVHLWRVITDDDGSARLVDSRCLGNADAGWTLACLIVSKEQVYSGHEKGVLCRWKCEGNSWSLTPIKLTDDGWVRTLRRDTRSGAVFAACGDGKIYKYMPGENSCELFVEHGASSRGLALLDEQAGAFLATGGDDGVVRLWTESGIEVASFGAHSGMIRALDARGSLLASSGTDGFARVWDIGSSVHLPRMKSMDADEVLVQFVSANGPRAFLASTGRETCLVKNLDAVSRLSLLVSGRDISTQNGEIELPTICLEATLSSDKSQVLALDIGGRIYLFKWSSA